MNILKPILIAIKITNKEVIKASVLLERIFKFKKFPISPPAKTGEVSESDYNSYMEGELYCPN